MKKIISLQAFMLMSLTLGSAAIMDAGTDSKKSSQEQSQSNGHKEMKAIEADLRKIQRDCKKSGNLEAANIALDKIPARIKEAVAMMKSHENAGKMWEVHEHTLNRKLQEARKVVAKCAKK